MCNQLHLPCFAEFFWEIALSWNISPPFWNGGWSKAGLLSANKVHWVQKSVIQTRDWKPRKDILSFVWTVGSHFVWPSPSPPLQTNIWRYTVGNNAWIFSAVERHPLLTRFRGSRCAKPPKCRHEIQPVNLACYTSSRSCLKIPAENSWIRKIRK